MIDSNYGEYDILCFIIDHIADDGSDGRLI